MQKSPRINTTTQVLQKIRNLKIISFLNIILVNTEKNTNDPIRLNKIEEESTPKPRIKITSELLIVLIVILLIIILPILIYSSGSLDSTTYYYRGAVNYV